MEKYTAEQIINELQELGLNGGHFEGFQGQLLDMDGEIDQVKAKFGEITVANEETGGEGAAEHCEMVLCFVDQDIYVANYGNYYSHYGTDWASNWMEVHPRQVTITKYDPVVKGSGKY